METGCLAGSSLENVVYMNEECRVYACEALVIFFKFFINLELILFLSASDDQVPASVEV
jgi:hypothetical protein